MGFESAFTLCHGTNEQPPKQPEVPPEGHPLPLLVRQEDIVHQSDMEEREQARNDAPVFVDLKDNADEMAQEIKNVNVLLPVFPENNTENMEVREECKTNTFVKVDIKINAGGKVGRVEAKNGAPYRFLDSTGVEEQQGKGKSSVLPVQQTSQACYSLQVSQGFQFDGEDVDSWQVNLEEMHGNICVTKVAIEEGMSIPEHDLAEREKKLLRLAVDPETESVISSRGLVNVQGRERPNNAPPTAVQTHLTYTPPTTDYGENSVNREVQAPVAFPHTPGDFNVGSEIYDKLSYKSAAIYSPQGVVDHAGHYHQAYAALVADPDQEDEFMDLEIQKQLGYIAPNFNHNATGAEVNEMQLGSEDPMVDPRHVFADPDIPNAVANAALAGAEDGDDDRMMGVKAQEMVAFADMLENPSYPIAASDNHNPAFVDYKLHMHELVKPVPSAPEVDHDRNQDFMDLEAGKELADAPEADDPDEHEFVFTRAELMELFASAEKTAEASDTYR